MPRPTSVFDWATGAGTRLAAFPSVGRQVTGWLPGEPFPALSQNALAGNLFDWAKYVSELSPTTGNLAVDGNTPPSGTFTNTGILISTAGLGSLDGVDTVVNTASKLGYSYAGTQPKFEYYVPSFAGGWFDMQLVGGVGYQSSLGSPSFVECDGNGTLVMRHQIVFGDDVTNAPTTHPWTIKDLAIRGYRTTVAEVVEMTLIRQLNDGSGAEAPLDTLTHVGVGWQNSTLTVTRVLDPDYAYFLDVRLVQTGGNNARFAQVMYSILKAAVE